jgi:hypothetical protein
MFSWKKLPFPSSSTEFSQDSRLSLAIRNTACGVLRSPVVPRLHPGDVVIESRSRVAQYPGSLQPHHGCRESALDVERSQSGARILIGESVGAGSECFKVRDTIREAGGRGRRLLVRSVVRHIGDVKGAARHR